MSHRAHEAFNSESWSTIASSFLVHTRLFLLGLSYSLVYVQTVLRSILEVLGAPPTELCAFLWRVFSVRDWYIIYTPPSGFQTQLVPTTKSVSRLLFTVLVY